MTALQARGAAPLARGTTGVCEGCIRFAYLGASNDVVIRTNVLSWCGTRPDSDPLQVGGLGINPQGDRNLREGNDISHVNDFVLPGQAPRAQASGHDGERAAGVRTTLRSS